MSMKKIVALTVMAAGMSAQAASTSTSTTSLSNIYQNLKDSPFKLNILNEVATNKGRSGVLNTTIGYLGYKISDKDSLQMENRFTFDHNSQRGSEAATRNEFSRWVMKYTRGKILTQGLHGVNMSANLEQRLYPDSDLQDRLNQSGLTRLSVKVSHEFSNVFSISGTLYGAVTQRKDKSVGGTTKNYTYLSMVENFQLTDKWYVAFIQEPYIGKRVDGTQSANIYNVLETGYQFTPEILGAVYTANTLENKAGDKLSFSNMGKAMKTNQEFAAYVYINAF